MARSSSSYTMLGPRPTEPVGYRGKPQRGKAAETRGPRVPLEGDQDGVAPTEARRERSVSARNADGCEPTPAKPAKTSGATTDAGAAGGTKTKPSAALKRAAANVATKAVNALAPHAKLQTLARAVAPPTNKLKPIKVDGLTVQPCKIEDLRPGDIGFVYQRTDRTRRQRLITLGERFINIFRRKRRGDAHIVHAFIVIKSNVDARKLLVADGAAGRKPFGINLMEMDFAHHTHVRPSAQYLFYRPEDAGLATRIAQVACTWTYANRVSNFSVRKAVHSTWHSARLSKNAGDRALYFASQADNAGPLRQPGSRITYNMMCSEFVTNVCVAATLTHWQARKNAAGKKVDMALTGLWKGPAGDTFAIDGKGTPPSVLQARLAHSKAMHAVGYLAGTDPA